MTLKTLFSARAVVQGTLLLGLAAGSLVGCGKEPDTSPAIRILSPIEDQTLPAGMPVDVRFTISGIDSSATPAVTFSLMGGDQKIPGKGHVRAYIDGNNFHARVAALPNDANPFLVPDPAYGSASSLLAAGRHEITLLLWYNDNPMNTQVDPQREGTVTINTK